MSLGGLFEAVDDRLPPLLGRQCTAIEIRKCLLHRVAQAQALHLADLCEFVTRELRLIARPRSANLLSVIIVHRAGSQRSYYHDRPALIPSFRAGWTKKSRTYAAKRS